MPFYQKGDVRIRYEEAGSGFPLLVTPGGGLNSRVSNWPTAVFNAMEEFKNDFHCITMDQRNANGGESTGPVPVENAWDAFADDQLGLMDHLGIREFFFMGYCIGGCFAGKLLQRAPERVVAAIFHQTVTLFVSESQRTPMMLIAEKTSIIPTKATHQPRSSRPHQAVVSVVCGRCSTSRIRASRTTGKLHPWP